MKYPFLISIPHGGTCRYRRRLLAGLLFYQKRYPGIAILPQKYSLISAIVWIFN